MHRRRLILAIFCSILALWSPAVGAGRQESNENQQRAPVTLSAAEVVVDVIVTDKKNRPITDLKPEDFEVYEDGVKQSIKSIRLVTTAEGPTARAEAKGAAKPGAPQPASVAARRPVHLIALVFDNLSMSLQSRTFARRAALDYVDRMAENDRVAIFGVDQRLFLVQPFTGDKKALKRAVNQATSGTSRQFASSAEAVARLLQSGSGEGAPPSVRLAAAEAYTPRPDENPGAAIEAVLLSTFRSFEAFEREAQARATVLALLSIIRGQQRLPGRKTLIFFSEGFSLPSNLWPQFQSVVGAANRANVAIYTIDAAGLRIESQEERVSRELSAMAEARARGADPTHVEGGESMLGRAESLGRMNTESVLIELAEATGGLSIRHTNDLRSGLRRIDEDMRSYYLLTYAPTNQTFDGRFRTIQVKVSRPGARVRARAGYFALRTAEATPVFAFERPLLELLFAASPPRDFALHMGALHFPVPGQGTKASVIAQIPADIVDFAPAAAETPKAKKKKKKKKASPQGNVYVGELDVLALVKDARGIVVGKLGQRYQLRAARERVEEMKRSNIIFYRSLDLRPGAYQVEIAARDARSGRASVTRAALHVPAPSSSALRLSSIIPTRGGEPLRPQERDESNPFHFGQTVIMPNLARTFSKSDEQMMFYFVVQTRPGATVQAKVEFLQQGQVLAQAPGTLPAPDERGRIQFLATFPVAPFPAGRYEVRVMVTDGTHRASEHASFTIVD